MENILITEKQPLKASSGRMTIRDYELLDSGGGEKLERYGDIILSRPDPQAIWPKSLLEEWQQAHAVYERTSASGKWKKLKDVPEKWNIVLGNITFSLELLPSKHLGVFPEQSGQWEWLSKKIKSRIPPEQSEGYKDKASATTVLNLFGYTGGATLACAAAGAEVCHVDASQFAVDKLVENINLSGLLDKPIRYIVDDARKFVEREIKRGNKYDIILLDPPVYGKGAKDEIWKLEEDLLPLLARMKGILSPDPIAIVLTGYASGYSHVSYRQILESVTSGLKGNVCSGELAIQESSSGRLLPAGIFARWQA